MDQIKDFFKEDINVAKYVDKSLDFIQSQIKLFKNLETFLKDRQNLLKLRRNCVNFVNKELNVLSKWELRKAVYDLFKRLDFKIDEQNLEKLVFLFFTDAVTELSPTPFPLIFDYKGSILVKRHSISIDFDVLPFLIENTEKLNPVKRHQILFEIFEKDKLILNGISTYLSQLNFLIILLLEKVISEEIIPFDQVVKSYGNKLEPDYDILRLGIESVFSALTSKFLGDKGLLKSVLLDKDKLKLSSKIKDYTLKQIEDPEEFKYLLFTSEIDEYSSVNRIEDVRNYVNQKNVFEESYLRSDADNSEKVESVFYLLGLNNINISLLVRYFDSDDIIFFLLELLRQGQDENYLTEDLKSNVKKFLLSLFNYPYISKGFLNQKTLDKAVNILFNDDQNFTSKYYYYTQRYEDFLNTVKEIPEKNTDLKLRQLTAKFLTGSISLEDYANWLTMIDDDRAVFLHHIITDDIDSMPEYNDYRLIAGIISGLKTADDVVNLIGEERYYDLILQTLSIYPKEEKLIKLLNLRFEV